MAARGSDPSIPANNRALARPTSPVAVPRIEAHSTANEWAAIARAGAHVSDIGTNWLRRETLKQRAVTTAAFEDDWRTKDTEAQDRFTFDPDGYKNFAEASKDAIEQEAPDWLLPHAREFVSARFDASYAAVLRQTHARTDTIARQTLDARQKTAESDVISIAMSGRRWHAGIYLRAFHL